MSFLKEDSQPFFQTLDYPLKSCQDEHSSLFCHADGENKVNNLDTRWKELSQKAKLRTTILEGMKNKMLFNHCC
jgi:hypothetical protein